MSVFKQTCCRSMIFLTESVLIANCLESAKQQIITSHGMQVIKHLIYSDSSMNA